MKAILFSLLISGITVMASPVAALDVPTETVVLTVKGNVHNTNVDGTSKFDLKMLEALSGRQATMKTPWTDGNVTFRGPYLRAILDAAGASGHKLVIHALNDYSAEAPIEDAQLDVILATRMNGELMSVRDKGPLFVIYPFDLDPSLYNEKYFARSVWQIKEIEVVD